MSYCFSNNGGSMERRAHINIVEKRRKEMTGRKVNEEDFLFFCTFNIK
jgi:hypothetical protein